MIGRETVIVGVDDRSGDVGVGGRDFIGLASSGSGLALRGLREDEVNSSGEMSKLRLGRGCFARGVLGAEKDERGVAERMSRLRLLRVAARRACSSSSKRDEEEHHSSSSREARNSAVLRLDLRYGKRIFTDRWIDGR